MSDTGLSTSAAVFRFAADYSDARPYERLVDEAARVGCDVCSLAFAEHMDRIDPLAEQRNEFLFPAARVDAPEGERAVYVCGHSLGLQPRATRQYINDELDAWARFGVDGHFESKHPWWVIDEIVQHDMAELVGARFDREVVVMNTLTVNLHLMMVPFYRPTATRFKIIIEERAFPSDYYAVCSQLRVHGVDVAAGLVGLTPKPGSDVVTTEDFVAALNEHGDSVALVLLPGVQYLDGTLYDVPRIVEATHKHGAVCGVDLAHAVGNVPLALHDWNVDFACWCTYKYLNSGPGSLGGVFLHDKYANSDLVRFAGWWGHRKDDRFQMLREFHPSEGAQGFQLSNPPVMPVMQIRASLDRFAAAGGMSARAGQLSALRSKSLLLTALMYTLLERVPHVKIVTTRDPRWRGCMLCLHFVDEPRSVKEIYARLREHGVIADVREPNIMRLAPTPLYNSFTDVWTVVDRLARVLTPAPLSAI